MVSRPSQFWWKVQRPLPCSDGRPQANAENPKEDRMTLQFEIYRVSEMSQEWPSANWLLGSRRVCPMDGQEVPKPDVPDLGSGPRGVTVTFSDPSLPHLFFGMTLAWNFAIRNYGQRAGR